MDSAASAQKPQAVIDAMTHVMEDHYANIHRGLYDYSQKTTTAYEAVRAKIGGFINAKSSNPIFKEVYDRLTGNGKPAKVALTAIMRKMVCLGNRIASDPVFVPA